VDDSKKAADFPGGEAGKAIITATGMEMTLYLTSKQCAYVWSTSISLNENRGTHSIAAKPGA